MMVPAPANEPARGRSTRAVHAGAPAARAGDPVVTPITQSTTFYTDARPGGEILYTRYGTNPNQRVLARRIAELEEAEDALVLGSGMAAIALTLLTFANAGDHIVAADALYGGTRTLLTREFPGLDIETTFVGADERWMPALRPNTRAMYIEVPSNPTLTVLDVPALAGLAHDRGLPLIIDATFATPAMFRPLRHGADVVVHSATKYLGGHSDVIAGAVAGPSDVIEELREKLKSFGANLDPHAAWLLERGLKTLPVRVERQSANALELARWLREREDVRRVIYPGLEEHPQHALASELFDGFGGMLGFVAEGGDEAALRIMERFEIIRVAPSLGGVETLASMPRYTSHANTSADERRALGIDPGFVRLSIGIEDSADLIAELAGALDAEPA